MGLSIKKLLPRTLLGRSLLILITPVLLIQVFATYMFFDRHWNRMTTRLAYSVAGEIAIMASALEDDPSSRQLEMIIASAAKNLDLLVSFDAGGILPEENLPDMRDVLKTMVTKTLARELRGTLRRPFVLHFDEDEKWLEVNVQLNNGVLRVVMPQRRLFSSSGYIFLLWMAGSSLVLLAIAILFMRNQVRPIRKLAAAAERFGKGRDVAYFKPEGAREVRQAGQSFLDMHRRIKRQVEQRTAMLAGVSHDLRTPLTRLKLQLAMFDDNADVKAMKGDIAVMERMIEGYLDFVRGGGDEPEEETPLSVMIGRVAEAAQRQGFTMETKIEQDRVLMLRPVAFERCLMNIINNAGKYADHIWLSCSMQGKVMEIVIEDNGPGIPEDQYEDVFRPFYRVDTSRNADTGGVGLGLPIAQDVVHSHGGSIRLERSARGGLKVVIRLPV